MGAANASSAPGERPTPPWWIRLSRWLNGTRVCSVGDCIELTDPGIAHCTTHIRAFRAALGGRCCAEAACIEPRIGGDPLCEGHREAVFIASCVAAAPGDRWNV